MEKTVKMEEIDENLYPHPPFLVITPLKPLKPSLRDKSRSECEEELKKYRENVAHYNKEVERYKREIDEYAEKLKTSRVKEHRENKETGENLHFKQSFRTPREWGWQEFWIGSGLTLVFCILIFCVVNLFIKRKKL